ncbi:MAG: DUF4189 domain-containing protein [bacterium]|nr:DUF4189 domain-containing protein [bacterium]
MYTFKIRTVFFIFLLGLVNPLLYALPSINLDTVITDSFSKDSPIVAKNSFSKDTPIIYIVWKSDKLKEGQQVKIDWIADDTNNVAPANYKIDSGVLTLSLDMKGKMMNDLPANMWDGKFSLSKPNNGWPLGTYHAEIFVDGDLVTKVPFSVTDAKGSTKIAPPKDRVKQSDSSWGAFAVASDKDSEGSLYGNGGGDTKEEAEKNAQQFCIQAGAKQCDLVLTYQQCGAYAFADHEHKGSGIGTTKKLAEEDAMKNCNSKNCTLLVSDCN